MIMANYTFHQFRHSDKPSSEQGLCAAIGFFDGVHRGHRYLISQVKAEAEKRGLLPVVITFEEHPRLALTHTHYWPELLTTNEQKLQLLSETGLYGAAMLHFDHNMSTLTSREFMDLILRKELHVKCLLVGYDHHFGSDLSATFRDYVAYGRELGIEVLRQRPFTLNDELRVSSSATRRFLAGGNVEMARACLGRPYTIEGTIVEGHHKGTLMGFPTANLLPSCPEQIIPGRGVYAVRATVGGFTYKAMLNIGWRPTFDNGHDQTIEAHLLDFDSQPLYQQHMILSFYRRVRDEYRFASIEALQKQLSEDADTVREMLDQDD